MEGGPPRFRPRFTGAVLLRKVIRSPFAFAYGTVALCGVRFHAASANKWFCNSCQAALRSLEFRGGGSHAVEF